MDTTRVELLARARAWLERDHDELTHEQLRSLLQQAESDDTSPAWAELAEAFDGSLTFGTAGLRGRIGPGSNRMNGVTVLHAAAGLAAFIHEHGGGAVVIGYDARHGSQAFAHVTAQVMSGAGLPAMLMPGPLPTPLLAFAIKHLGCAAGVMVTASHNPPQDNGYKVYLGDGRQIVEPEDELIAQHIARAAALPSIDDIPLGHHWSTLDDTIVEAYVERAVSLLESEASPSLTIAYTPMHGVGGATFTRLMSAAGFGRIVPVEAQFEPDPDFPTVEFPNPEEPGAMDLGLATAQACDAHLLIANDPDADRCAVGLPRPDGWRMLTGDELGWLLAWWIGAGNRRLARSGTMAQSIVSGTMLEGIARDYNLGYAHTLTGFKWIARVPDLVFGYEEALGYCVDPIAVPDKDGLTAALLFAELTLRLAEQGASPLDILDDLAREYGVFATGQVSVRMARNADRLAAMARIRTSPPSFVGTTAITRVDDLLAPTDGLPPTDGLRMHLADGSRVVIRPSGTEPKVKCYLQAVVAAGEDLGQARAEAQVRLVELDGAVRTWLTPPHPSQV